MSKAKPWYTGAFPRYRDKHEPPEVIPQSKKIPSKTWKKKYKCKKNKGDHTFKVRSIWNSIRYVGPSPYWLRGIMHAKEPFAGSTEELRSWVDWECTACKKQEHEHFSTSGYRTGHKKFESSRPGY